MEFKKFDLEEIKNIFKHEPIETEIFDECGHDVDIFGAFYGEDSSLTEDEGNHLKALLSVVTKYGAADVVSHGISQERGVTSIFKIFDGKWVVWKTDLEEESMFTDAELYRNIVDACDATIKRVVPEEDYNDAMDAYNHAVNVYVLTPKVVKTLDKVNEVKTLVKKKIFTNPENND